MILIAHNKMSRPKDIITDDGNEFTPLILFQNQSC